MKKLFLLLFILIATMNNINSQEREPMVLIETDFGNIKLKLYNETPQHRDNFLKLIREGFYKDLLFHRVIQNFMIQGGDPNSRGAADSTRLGAGDLEYKIPAEIVYPQYYHKKGALAAARTGNDVNPNKESSATQFYIVVGKKYSDKDMNKMETEKIDHTKQTIYNNLQSENKAKIKEFYSSGDLDGLAAYRQGLYAQAEVEAEKKNPRFTPEQRSDYKEIGGAPHLDREYTVFGEVLEGLDVVDKIQKVKTSGNDRPVQSVKMNITVIE
ncbi:peptidylprolyl isomerase [Dysgonomonas sp. OttesenSCG-928-M03]|nr:peptidylprolyl isomerase [Dysgonomonas sp. OttesenSCG-928-M03]